MCIIGEKNKRNQIDTYEDISNAWSNLSNIDIIELDNKPDQDFFDNDIKMSKI